MIGVVMTGLASLVIVGSSGETQYPSPKYDPLDSQLAYHSEAEESALQLVALQSTATVVPTNAPHPFATLDAILATAQLNTDQRATVNAAIKAEINAAVEGTLLALTPPPTPFPTRIPVAQTIVEHNPYRGPEDAPITMVEFSDYWCTFCGRFHSQVLEPLLDHYGDLLRFVYREYPVIGGQASATIGAAAQCAGFQGQYWEFTDQVWENVTGAQEAVNDEVILEYASNIDIDMEAFETCIAESDGLNNVNIDYQAGLAYNITGTPTFFINGIRLVGAQPIEVFMNAIDSELLDLGIEPPSRSDVSSSNN